MARRNAFSMPEEKKKSDPLNPDYYITEEGLEATQVMEAFRLNFHLGSCVQYILRAGKKRKNKRIRDLEKARWHLNREIEYEKAMQAVREVEVTD